MRIDVLTLFPSMFMSPLQESVLKRAQQHGLLTVVLHQLRDYALDRHQMTDDVPYGGGEGMVMKPEPFFRAVDAIAGRNNTPVILLTPQGRLFTQKVAIELSHYSQLVMLCGHYEGVDERVRTELVTHELSIGDYVLTGGELPAMVIIDALSRLIPGVLGAAEGAWHDSHASGVLEGPQYTRPPLYRGLEVPSVLLSGNHAAIARWRRYQALWRTWKRRPDMLEGLPLTKEESKWILEFQRELSEPESS